MKSKLSTSMSPLYDQLSSTAQTYVKLYEFNRREGKEMDTAQMRSFQADDFTQSWGHSYMVSQRPALQGRLNHNSFFQHLQSVVPHLERVAAKIHDVLVDEGRRTVTVQMSYFLTPLGSSEAAENDLVWVLELDESGKRIRASKEYIDSLASTRLGELIQASKSAGSDQSFLKSTG